jgi:predicted glycosyltransferase
VVEAAPADHAQLSKVIRNRLYYRIKPMVPPHVRMSIRRWFAVQKRERVLDTWPILPGSEKPPANWPGWPNGKKFAFVLTHDVEGQAGLDKCRQLMELELRLGFRSSFNFIPEGDYRVPLSLINELKANGFEVGVHDLHHDGKLYRNRQEFARKAARINEHLRKWGVGGFRSGFMLHNLEWLHDLDVAYDASTFDTDPFEPQPDGVGTIFPFWVPAPNTECRMQNAERGNGKVSDSAPPTPRSELRNLKTGYVELPYTLPQDSTLFLLLRERHPDIWFQKLDWIVKHGGMALLDTHPDFMAMGRPAGKGTEYPLDMYSRFLEYARERYGDCAWKPLPAELAAYTRRALAGNQQSADSRSVNGYRSKPKIWIDLDNTPHVPFFEPILEELRARGYPVLVTARDAFQVCDLADKKGISYTRIGRHHGKHRLVKGAGLAYRAAQLAPIILKEKPALAVSHGSRAQILLSNFLKVPTLLIEDYEYSQFPPLMRPTWIMAPEVIPNSSLRGKNGHVRKYPGIKEDVYAWKLSPDSQPLRELGVRDSDLVITVRPPATEAHYHNPESEELFRIFMERACRTPGVKLILLPRNRKQAETIKSRWPNWFQADKTVIPGWAMDGLNLIWHSDLVVSGGGTMNREAAALGVPVYSIFRGSIGAVDKHLQSQERLIMVETPQDVGSKIKLVRRRRGPVAEVTSRTTLRSVVDCIEEIAGVVR